ncbi:hypothetical protein D9M73_70860 [compost metagenome]
MLIHAYRRKDATPVHTGKNNIEFKPNATGDVVAEVADQGDIDVLLAIPEGYRAYEGAESTGKAAKPPAKKEPTAEQIAATEAAVAAAAAASAASKSATPPAGNGAEGGTSDEKPFLLKGEKPEDDIDLGAMDLAALKEFASTNKIRLHHTWTEEVVRQKLFEAFAPE